MIFYSKILEYIKVQYIANKKLNLYVNIFRFEFMSDQVQTQTSKNKQTQSIENIFDVYKQNVEKYFESIESTVPQYIQSLTGIEEEWCKTCRNAATSVISLQQEFAKKTGINIDVPEAARNAIIDTNKQIIKARSVQSQIAQTASNAIQQNIKTWNDNASAFTDLNRNILQSWISTFTQKGN
jgi:thiol-disulfide isomerase/thioredoxin